MTFSQAILNYLEELGMWPDQAKAVLALLQIPHPEGPDILGNRWNENTSEYPPAILSVLKVNAKLTGLKYLKENQPKAWFLPMFES